MNTFANSAKDLADSVRHMVDEADQFLKVAAESGDAKLDSVRGKLVEQVRRMRTSLTIWTARPLIKHVELPGGPTMSSTRVPTRPSTGCAHLLPRRDSEGPSQFESFEAAAQAFDKI